MADIKIAGRIHAGAADNIAGYASEILFDDQASNKTVKEKIEEVASSPQTMIVTISSDGNYTADKTFAEIKAFIDNGGTVIAKDEEDGDSYYYLDNYIASEVVFCRNIWGSNGFTTRSYTIDNTNTVTFDDSVHHISSAVDSSSTTDIANSAAVKALHDSMSEIKSISVNNTEQQVDQEGNVDIAVPDSLADLAGDSTHRTVTDAEKATWNGKQDALTFDNVPTANSNNPVKSGGVYQAIQDIDVSSQISGKADKSEMSVVAGTGANADKTTITLKSGTSATVLTQHQDVSGKEDKSNKVTSFSSPTDTQYPSAKLVNDQLATKQNTISDLSTIRSGASAGATAYQKPGTGIPSTDLASAVQTSLGKADTAIQSVTVGTTTTGAAGTNASVVNGGTATAPVLNFTIPQGAQGVKGDTVIMGGESSYTLYNTTGDAVDGAMTQQAVTRELTELEGNIHDDLVGLVEVKNIATFTNGGFIKQNGTIGSNAGFSYVDHLDISEYSKLTIYCRAYSSSWNVLMDENNTVLYSWQQNSSPYLKDVDLTQYPTAKYVSLSNYTVLNNPYVDAFKEDDVPTKTKIANLQNQIDETNSQVSALNSQGKRYGYNFDFVPDQTGGYISADGSFVSNSAGHYCQDVDISEYTLIGIKCNTGSYYCVLKDANNAILSAKKGTGSVVFDITNEYPTAKYLSACSIYRLCVSGFFTRGDLNKYLVNIPSDWWLQQQRFSPSLINGYFNNYRSVVGITGSYTQYHFVLAVEEGYSIYYAGYGSGTSLNYAFYSEDFAFISLVSGHDYTSGITITIPSGVAFVEFCSLNPSGRDYPLHVSSDNLPDLNNSSSVGSSIGNVLYGKSYVCGGDSTSSANVVTEEGATEGDSYTLIPYGEVIARRNNMVFSNQAHSGGDIYTTGTDLKSAINANTDYLTCMFGGNESGRTSSHPIGEVDSSDTNTFYGAYNDLMRYCLTTNPTMKILLITPVFDYTQGEIMQAVINVAKRWGCGYLNTYSDPHVPLTYQTAKSSELGLCAEARTLRQAAMNISSGNVHPTQAGADAFSTIVEAYMRAL